MKGRERGRSPTTKEPVPKDTTRLSSEREQALFEAGIKLGGVFHQFIGVPVSTRTSKSLSHAMEEAVGLQPFVSLVRVKIDPNRSGEPGSGRFGYKYLTAEMLDAEVTITVGSARVRARLAFRADLNYPLMRVVAVTG